MTPPGDARPVVARLRLPDGSGATTPHAVRAPAPPRSWGGRAPASRVVYAAAHVCPDPLSPAAPGEVAAVDWDTTLAFRRSIWATGLGVADAMDTAQRGAGLRWPQARELIRRSGAEARACGGALVCGATTDQLDPDRDWTLDDLAAAYLEQVDWITASGGVPVLMASRLLVRAATTPEDYRRVYDRVLAGSSGPLVLHWLGAAFDPGLESYWGGGGPDRTDAFVLDLLRDHSARFAGIKVSLLDAGREVALRRRLPPGVRMFTGDDLHYDELIRGDGEGASDALLGAFAGFAPAARQALEHLDAGDTGAYDRVLGPTVTLARHLFAAPTPSYKTGIAFLAFLNGHQRHPLMLAGAQAQRSVLHLCELFRLADRAAVLLDPPEAARRMTAWLEVSGA